MYIIKCLGVDAYLTYAPQFGFWWSKKECAHYFQTKEQAQKIADTKPVECEVLEVTASAVEP